MYMKSKNIYLIIPEKKINMNFIMFVNNAYLMRYISYFNGNLSHLHIASHFVDPFPLIPLLKCDIINR